jgi:hypothetical protein
MNLKVKIGLLFAAVGYAIVVAIGLLCINLNVNPTKLLLCLAPVLILIATEDCAWGVLLVVLAPLNAVLYGGIAVALTSALQHFLGRKKSRVQQDCC